MTWGLEKDSAVISRVIRLYKVPVKVIYTIQSRQHSPAPFGEADHRS